MFNFSAQREMLSIPVLLYFLIQANFYSCPLANPFVGLLDPKCKVVQGECPQKNITFWLYTNATADTPRQLDPLNLNPLDFQPRRLLKILIHGYTGHRDYAPNTQIRPVLLANDNVYVISPDYGRLVPEPCYFSAVKNLPLVSKCIAQLINNLVDGGIVQNDDIHVIGFSLGAQVAGQTANYVKHKLKHITGLDPAKPMFITVGKEGKLDPTDADFVDVVHTDVLGRGMLRAMGHADFYPNIGPYQPGCQDENKDDPGSCNHDRAPTYYAESIRNSNGFWAYSCPSWFHYVFGLCSDIGNDSVMGYRVSSSAKGSYFLKTGRKSPFALGHIAKPNAETIRKNQLDYSNTTPKDLENFEPLMYKLFLKYEGIKKPSNPDILKVLKNV